MSYRKFNLASYTEKIKYPLWYVRKLNFYVQVARKHSKSVAWTVLFIYLFLQLYVVSIKFSTFFFFSAYMENNSYLVGTKSCSQK